MKGENMSLSDVQSGMLIHSRATDHGLYNTQVVMTFEESVEIDHLENVWNYLLKKYEVLRAYIENDKVNIAKNSSCRLDVIYHKNDIGCYEDIAKVQYDRKIALNKPPLFNLTLYVDHEVSYLIWTHHHLFISANTFKIIIRDMFQCYDNRVLEEDGITPVPYQSYQNTLSDEQKKYWFKLLEGYSASTTLKLANISEDLRPDDQKNIEITSKLTKKKMKQFAMQEGVTVNTLIMGAWTIILSYYTRQDDLVFGTVRQYASSSSCPGLGMDVTTLPVRVKIENKTVSHMLKEIHEQQKNIKENTDVSLIGIKKNAFKPLKDGDEFFNTCVDYQPASLQDCLIESCEHMERRSASFRSKTHYPLTLSTTFEQNKLVVKLGYNPTIFNEEMANQLVNLFLSAIDLLMTDVSQVVSDIHLIKCEDKPYELNPRVKEKSIPELFDKIVDKYPKNIAISDGECELDYQELNKRANQVSLLIQKFILPGNIVALHMKPSVSLVIAMLGILKSGNAYLCINSDYPSKSKLYMLEDSMTPLVICDEGNIIDITDHLLKERILVKTIGDMQCALKVV